MSQPQIRLKAGSPRVSVVIAVYNGGADIHKCLDAVAALEYPNFECIVVDDVSSDGEAEAAARRHGMKRLVMDRRSGPAIARNRGAWEAGGEILFFTDADVMLHPDALSLAVGVLESEPKMGAVFGSYDDQPGHPSFLSQYRNLLHHWVHQHGAEEAWTFWAGCGAIRREVFVQLGGFSESFARPSIEDIELGARIRQAGYGIRLQKNMLGSHLKRWTFWNMMKTDVFSRAVPWMKLLLQEQSIPSDLNVDIASRVATLAAGLLLFSLLLLPLIGHSVAVFPALIFLLLACTAAFFPPPLLQGSGGTVLAFVIAILPPVLIFARYPDSWALLPLAFILLLAAARWGFLSYLGRIRSGAFALVALPAQTLFFVGCGAAIPLGILAHWKARRQALAGRRR